MDRLDAILLDAVQEEFPVCSTPYEAIALACGTSPEEAERRISRMRRDGVIRRLGAVLDSRALGMLTTLAAADVRGEAVEEVAAHLDGLPEVTHSYLREGRPNLWFALVAAPSGQRCRPDRATSQETVDEILEEVRAFPGVLSVAEFPATKVFKLAVKVGASTGERPE